MKAKLNHKQKRTLTISLIILIILEMLLGTFAYHQIKGRQLREARHYGEIIATNVRLALNESMDISQTMKNLYLDYEENYLRDFAVISDRQMKEDSSIIGLFFTKQGVITNAYPATQNSALGIDVFEVDEERDSAILARDSGMITISGPHVFGNGFTGFIIRNPIWINNDKDFLGFSIVVLDWRTFEAAIVNSIDSNDNIYKFGIFKDDDEIVTDEDGYIIKNCEGAISDQITIDVDVPNDTWQMVIEPRAGWAGAGLIITMFIVFMLSIFAFVFTVYHRMRDNAQRLYDIEHDDLTGLLNRQAYYNYVETMIKDNPGKHFEIFAADVENFKMVNSVYGEAKGNEVLKYLADCFKNALKDGIVARYGGDQFVCIILSENNPGREYFEKFAEDVIKNAPVKNLTVKYGHYRDVDMHIPITEMFDRALLASKSIKNKFGIILENYEGQVSRTHLRNQMLEANFEEALENGEFKIWFQPKFGAGNDSLEGAEALVRWIQNDGTVIPPMAFIQLFEQDGLIVKLDEFVFRTVCNLIKEWISKGYKPIPISVNLSRNTLYRDGEIEKYTEIVESIGIDKELVPIELTESAELHSVQIKEYTDRLKNAGFKLHMDDFGAGFSSLASLNILPFDVVKLDKSLIDFIGEPGGEELIRHTIELAHFKKMKIVAEGVETKEQLAFLRERGCDYIQGYYYSPPKPQEAFEEFITIYYPVEQ